MLVSETEFYSARVALTTSDIYAFCPFAARYFSASEREACVARRPRNFGKRHFSDKHIAGDSVPRVSHLNVSIWL